MRSLSPVILLLCSATPGWTQGAQLKTAAEVLDRYKQARGGPDAIQKVQSETVRGEIEGTGITSKVTFVYYAKPFKNLIKVTMPDGSEIQSGFDGTTSWTIRKNAASLDKDTPVESARRDTDLQYALHQTDYFKSLELAGVTDFEGHHCYWLHGTTRWGKDNNQFYDVDTGLLAGYRFQADDGSGNVVIALFDDYKNFVGPLVATKNTSRSGDHSQTLIYKSISYDPIPDSTFDLLPSVKPLGWMRRPWRGCNVRNMNPEKAEALSPELQSALEPLLEEIESLSERIAEYNDRIEALAQKSYPQVELLKQIKGVGTLIARPSNSASCNQWLASASRA